MQRCAWLLLLCLGSTACRGGAEASTAPNSPTSTDRSAGGIFEGVMIYSPSSCGPGVQCPPNEPPGTYEVRVVYLGAGSRWYRLRVSYTW